MINLDNDSIAATLNSSHSPDTSFLTLLSAINFWLLLAIILIGYSGNIFAVVAIWKSPNLRRISSNHYLIALALSDNMFIFALSLIWLNKLGLPTYNNSTIGCKIGLFLMNSSGCLSAWFVMALTSERFIVVYFPLYRRAICSVGRTRRAIGALVPWPILFNVWVLIGAVIKTDDRGHYHCDVSESFFNVILILNGIDMGISFCVPVLVIVSVNTAICIRLWTGDQSSFSAGGSREPTPSRSVPKSLLSVPSGKRKKKSDPTDHDNRLERRALTGTHEPSSARDDMRKHAKVHNQERKITKTLLIISFVYVALNLPSYSIRLWASIDTAITGRASNPTRTSIIIENVFLLIYYTNFALNFVVYCLSSKNFRDAVKNVWCRGKGSPRTSSNSNYTNTNYTQTGSRSVRRPSPKNSPNLGVQKGRYNHDGNTTWPAISNSATLEMVTSAALDESQGLTEPNSATGSSSQSSLTVV